jgi:hypothetical protein
LSDLALEEAWIARTLERDDLLAAGAIVEAMASDDLETLLPEELYGADGAAAYEPGPIAHEVARLSSCFGERLTVMTTNYDDLIERALLHGGYAKKLIKSYVTHRHMLTPGAVPVTHLHGFAGREGEPRRLVLTEEHYHRMQRGTSWQEQYVTKQLEQTLCLFVGTSLTDPNLIRYLYGYKKPSVRSHAAVFVRQGDMEGPDDAIRAVREEAATKRWNRCGVEAIFVDHFADAAQLVHEISYCRASGSAYVPVADRAASALAAIADVALRTNADADAFAGRQVDLSRWLRETLYRTLRSALNADPPTDESLALALWLLDADGTAITGWAHSDRAHQDPLTIESVPIRPDSTWVSVRAICQGVRVELDRASDVSRWRFVRGLPLILDSPTRLPIGCLTISSTRPGETSILNTMSESAKAALHEGLLAAIRPELARVVQQTI